MPGAGAGSSAGDLERPAIAAAVRTRLRSARARAARRRPAASSSDLRVQRRAARVAGLRTWRPRERMPSRRPSADREQHEGEHHFDQREAALATQRFMAALARAHRHFARQPRDVDIPRGVAVLSSTTAAGGGASGKKHDRGRRRAPAALRARR